MKGVPYLLTASAFLLLFSCAGAPPARERERWQILQAEAQAALERCSPETLQAAAVLMGSAAIPKHFRAQAEETSALAARLFGLLFPQLARQAGAPPAGAPPARDYAGSYAQALDLAERGRPPAGAVTADPVAAGGGWLAVLLPFVFLHHPEAAGVTPGADRILQEAAAQYPHSPLPPYLQGALAERAGELEAALGLYRESLNRAPSFYPARLRLASLQLRSGAAAAAAVELERLLHVLPGDPTVRLLLAESALVQGQGDQALRLSAELQNEDPQDSDFLLLRARVLAGTGDWSQALKPLNLLLASSPAALPALLLKAQILAENAHEEEAALELLRDAAARFPADPGPPELEGRILLALGDEAEGARRLEEALAREPARVSALRTLLDHALARKSWPQAAGYVARLFALKQSAADLALAYRIHASLGDVGQALAYAEQLQALSTAGAHSGDYAAALLAAGRKQEALRVVEETLGAADPLNASRLLWVKASISADAGQAIQLLQQALGLFPENLPALLSLAELFLAENDFRKARLYLSMAGELAPENPEIRLRLERTEDAAR